MRFSNAKEKRISQERRERALALLREHGPVFLPAQGKGMGGAGLVVRVGDAAIAYSTIRRMAELGMVRRVRTDEGLQVVPC